MKKILFIAAILLISLTSCETIAYTCDTVPYNRVIVTNGIPYYYGSTVGYYFYNGAYYYPYGHDGNLHFRRYRQAPPPPKGMRPQPYNRNYYKGTEEPRRDSRNHSHSGTFRDSGFRHK